MGTPKKVEQAVQIVRRLQEWINSKHGDTPPGEIPVAGLEWTMFTLRVTIGELVVWEDAGEATSQLTVRDCIKEYERQVKTLAWPFRVKP